MSKNEKYGALREATRAALFSSDGTIPVDVRLSIANGTPPPELVGLVQKIRTSPHTVTDQDLDALRGKYDEDALFEIILAAAVGAAHDRLAAVSRALEDA